MTFSFRLKLQLLVLPLVVLPVTTASLLYTSTIRNNIITLQTRILQYEVDTLLTEAEEIFGNLVGFGLHETPYYQNQVMRNIKKNAEERNTDSTAIIVLEETEGEVFLRELAGRKTSKRGTYDAVPPLLPADNGPYLLVAEVFEPLKLVIVSAVPSSRIDRLLREANFWPVMAALGYLAFFLPLVLISTTRFTSPLSELSTLVNHMAEGDLSARAGQQSADEVGSLARDINNMADRLEASTHYLEQTVNKRTEDLTRSLDNLRSTQSRLIESEKMASLGSLVAGIAHEINTPIGTAITAISHIEDSLTDHEMEIDPEFREMGENLTRIALTGLNKAAVLVRNFKQVAIDQHSEELRFVDLKSHLKSIIVTLKPELKRSKLSLEIYCPDEIVFKTYPGAVWQIISNLVLNASIHAFTSDDEGTILVSARYSEDEVILKVADDGAGIPEDLQRKIYEPFITTRRNAGGTGLGLQIVYNLVTQLLRGRIEMESTPDKGTVFTVFIPENRE